MTVWELIQTLEHFYFPLAYADDITLLTDSLQSAKKVLQELEKELHTIGLTVNESKCSIMLRDPIQSEPPITKLD